MRNRDLCKLSSTCRPMPGVYHRPTRLLATVWGISLSQALLANNPTALEEVIVTAQKRQTNVQTTDIAITAISGEFINENGVQNIKDLDQYLPNVMVGEGSRSAAQIVIRGVFSTAGDAVQSTAFHLDGVYHQRPSGAKAVFYDLERVEVLRGPQGTLWGRNATAGSVNVITRKPQSELGGDIEVGTGNYNSYNVKGAVNVPVIDDTWKLRAAYLYDTRDSYIKGISPDASEQGIDNTAFRLHSLYEPSENIGILLSGDYWKKTGDTNFFVPPDPAYDPDESPNVTDDDIEASDVRAEVSLGFDGFDLVALTGYRDYDQHGGGPLYSTTGGGNYNLTRHLDIGLKLNEKTLSQELRASSSGEGPWQWTVGGLYFDLERDEDFFISALPVFSVTTTYPDETSTSYAAFGQLSRDIADNVTLTGGLRYSDDQQKVSNGTRSQTTIGQPDLVVTYNTTDSWSRTDWKVGADWRLTPDNFLYASVGTGYKAGGLLPASYDEETLVAYEAGSKNQFMNDRAQLNVAAFYYDYDDLQVGRIVGGEVITDNANAATIMGLEAEFTILVTERLELSGYTTYLDTEYGDYQAVNNLVRPPVAVDVSGNSMPRAPEFTSLLRAVYEIPVADGSLSLRANWNYTSKVYFTEFEDAGAFEVAKQDANSRFDASIRYDSGSGDWYAEVFGTNLTDEQTLNFAGPYPPIGTFLGSYSDPYLYGFRLGLSF